MSLCGKALYNPVLTMCVCAVGGVCMPEYSQRTKVQGKSHPPFKVKLFQNPKRNSGHPVFTILFFNKCIIYSAFYLFQPLWLSFPVLDRTEMNLVFIIHNSVHVILTSFFSSILPVPCNSAFSIYTCMFSTSLPHSCPLKRHQKIPPSRPVHGPHFNPLYLEHDPSYPDHMILFQ